MLICVTQLFKFIDYEELKALVYIFHWPDTPKYSKILKRER